MAPKAIRGWAVQDQENRVTALLGGTPGPKLRNKPMPLGAEFKAQAQLRRERWAAASKLSRAILAPVHKIIEADKKAIQAAKALQRLKPPSGPKRSKVVAPHIKSHVRPGSILTFRGLPYDNAWVAGSGSTSDSVTSGMGGADPSSGVFGAGASAMDGGSPWGAGGLAVWFQPISDNTYVRFAADAFGDCFWDDNSFGYVAHNNAFIGVLIESWDFNGQNYRIDQDRRITLWSDGTGWWEEHGFNNPFTVWFPNDTYFIADAGRWYRVWTWTETWCDAEGPGIFGSLANGAVPFQSNFCVFEQWT